MISLDFLDNVEAFNGLDDNQLAVIVEAAELMEFKKGDRLFTQGDDATNLWILMDGDIELRSETADPEQVSFLSSAHAFGWTCFVPPYKYQLSGYCASRRSRVIRIEKTKMDKLFPEHPEIGFALMQYTLHAVGTQFQELEDELAQHRGHDIMSHW